jgi:hypothetical protein
LENSSFRPFAPFECVINQFTRSYARSPRHRGTLYQSHYFRQEKG